MKKKNRKIFDTRYYAEKFAKENNGKVEMVQLPGYNYVDIIYVVEW